MTEKEKMLRGDPYDPTDKELTDLRANAHRLSQLYNAAFDTEEEKRRELLDGLMPDHGINCYLQGPIQFDYGVFTSVGDHFYANFNFTVLDTCPVVIGDHVFFGPNCTIATALHYFDPILRRTRQREDRSFYDIEFGKPVAIGSDCWLGAGCMVGPGVTIGSGTVIGMGSVVTKDIPAGVVAAGNPARILRPVGPEDDLYYAKGRKVEL